jgi:hypothetical protein
MMEAPRRRRLLFLNADSRDPITQHRTCSKSLDSKIRRHLMTDIGVSRRKPSKAPQFDFLVWSLTEKPRALLSIGQDEHSMSQSFYHMQVFAKNSVVAKTATQQTTLCTRATPILHALSVFEREWGEDWFSAYGFTLIMVAGKNAMDSSEFSRFPYRSQSSPPLLIYSDPAFSTNTFRFPFAFQKSAFHHYYQQVFTSPDVLISLYRSSAKELRSLALERSIKTIQCVEFRLSSSDASFATSDSVLNAVLALVCYNVSSTLG